jgi:hypothetical protein
MLAGPAPLPPASQRKRSRMRRTLYAIAAPLLYALARVLWSTCRVEIVEGKDRLDLVLSEHRSCIPTFWHEQLVSSAIFLIDHFERHDRQLAFLISPSVDGDLVTGIVERAGGRVVRGSATRSGVKSLRDLYRLSRKESASPLFTPDGPQGPARECKLGAILLAQLTGTPIVPLAAVPHRAWRLRTWDRLQIPWPFTLVRVAIGEPLLVDGDTEGAGLDELRGRLQVELDRVSVRRRAV